MPPNALQMKPTADSDPTIKEVPVSEMAVPNGAWVCPFIVIPSMLNCQNAYSEDPSLNSKIFSLQYIFVTPVNKDSKFVQIMIFPFLLIIIVSLRIAKKPKNKIRNCTLTYWNNWNISDWPCKFGSIVTT